MFPQQKALKDIIKAMGGIRAEKIKAYKNRDDEEPMMEVEEMDKEEYSEEYKDSKKEGYSKDYEKDYDYESDEDMDYSQYSKEELIEKLMKMKK